MPTISVADGVDLQHEILGEGEPVLLITGTSASIGLWTPAVLEGLAADHRVVAYDHRGMGGSTPSTEPVSMASLAADAAALLDGLGTGPAHVIGWSLGSAVAQELALARPDLVASLVLYGTWARDDGFQRSLLAGLRGPWAAGDIPLALQALGVAFSPQMLDHPEFEALFGQFLPLFPQTPEQVAMTVNQWDADLAHDTADRLATIDRPTTVLVGEQDLLTPHWQSRRVADLIPGAEFVLVKGPGSSHGMHVERPDDWLGHVRDHLARHATVAAG
jgi:pimeloyl-ACP methyl ester carboxylesterase